MDIANIIITMKEAGIDLNFIIEASEVAKTDQGVYELMEMWLTSSENERLEIIGDIQDSLDDYKKPLFALNTF